MRISTNFCLSPFNQEPSYCDKILSKLDNYFYFGGKQVEIVGRNERTQEILCISSSGRHVPIAEKIIKILSYVLLPIVLVALLIRFLLHKALNSKVVLMDRQGLGTPCESYLNQAKAIRNKFILLRYAYRNDNNALKTALNSEGLKVVHFYREETTNQLLLTMTSQNLPNIAFTLAIPVTTATPEEREQALMKHLWNCIQSINTAKRQNLDHLMISNPIGIHLKYGMIIHCIRDIHLTEHTLNKHDASTSVEEHNHLQNAFNDLVNFTVLTGYPGKVFAKSDRKFVRLDSATNSRALLIIDPGHVTTYTDKNKEREQRVTALIPILQHVPPEYLQGMLNQIPRSIKSKIKNLHFLLSQEFLDKTLDIQAPLFTSDHVQTPLSNQEKRQLVQDFLNFIARRAVVQNTAGRKMIVFYQGNPGEGEATLMNQYNNCGSMFYKPEGTQEKCLGESLMDQLIAIGIFSSYESTENMICAYFD
ncbi:DUF648 domain-containing protein [Chlamydia psittaci]|uniref:DUF648 domain-containing protein n=1 Tax=Chlamydia psittaci TaxID=83554 RepID=UPI00027E55EF|nr:DUF648 domain-containing protein [Chlamydia psittaci]AFS27039.1 hypothetical protein B711_0641 [Chlamydia psittaci CP3]KPZ35950.1 membrane protein [Chlamydia psittaci CP3]MBE3635726.1 DUF648 domain-containing protein [Chlamydia psittaci]BEU44232.1 DUF648 domain-containing protein [Chlamydia psittaci]